MSENTDTRGGTSVVDYSSVRKIKPPRLLFALTLGVLYVVFGLLVYLNRGFEQFFKQIGIGDLPVPTETVLMFGRFLQTPLGMGLAAFSFLGTILLVLKGTLDRILRLLIAVNIVAIILFMGFSLLGAYAPMLKKTPAGVEEKR